MSAKKSLPANAPLSLKLPKDEPKVMVEAIKVGSTRLFPVSPDYGKPINLGKISPGRK